MTAHELYTADPDFREFITRWEEDRRCPWVLSDWLRDRGLEELAATADWAAAAPERPSWICASTTGLDRSRASPRVRGPAAGLFPFSSEGDYVWDTVSQKTADEIPYDLWKASKGKCRRLTLPDAFVYLLDLAAANLDLLTPWADAIYPRLPDGPGLELPAVALGAGEAAPDRTG